MVASNTWLVTTMRRTNDKFVELQNISFFLIVLRRCEIWTSFGISTPTWQPRYLTVSPLDNHLNSRCGDQSGGNPLLTHRPTVLVQFSKAPDGFSSSPVKILIRPSTTLWTNLIYIHPWTRISIVFNFCWIIQFIPDL